MSNQFVARNGLIAQNTSTVTGSFLVTGGNVGIGTATPTHLLNVYTTVADTGILLDSNTNPSFIIKRAGVERLKLTATDAIGTINGLGNGLVFQTDSTEQMRISTTGNVGIGTSTPGSSKLSIQADWVSGNGTVKVYPVTSIAAGGAAGYTMFDSDGTTRISYFAVNSGAVEVWGAQNTPMHFATNNSVKMAILANGNVGIGTTSPSEKLDVVGYGKFSGTNANVRAVDGTIITKLQSQTAGGTQGAIGTESNNDLVILTNNTIRAIVTTSGNIGINTTSPSARLQVSGSTNTVNFKGSGSAVFSVDGTAGRLFQVDDTLSGSLFSVNTVAGLPVIEALSDYSVNLGTYSAVSGSTVTITGSSVGIGTSTPGTTLDVRGNIRATSFTGSFSGSITTSIGSNTQVIYNNAGVLAGSNNFVFNGTNVGIGTTSAGYPLDVKGAGTIARITDGTSHMVFYAGSNLNEISTVSPLLLTVNGSERMRITTGGNVGIGTSSPATKLHLYGIGGSGPDGSYLTMIIEDPTGIAGQNKFGIGTRIAENMFAIQDLYANATRLVINANGNIGIGTTSPYSKFTTYGALSTSTSQISIINSEGGHAIIRSGITGQSNNGMSFVIADVAGTNQNVAVVIASGGNVGIGTTNPSYKLEVNGNIWASDYYIQNTSGTSGTFRIDGYQDYLYFYGDTSAITGYRFGSDTAGIVMQINTNGNVGIGTTSPNSQLDAYTSQGGSRISATHGTGGSYPKASGISFGATSTSLTVSNNGSTVTFTGGAGIYANNGASTNNPTDLVFWTTAAGSPTERMRITSGGSVGIGTTSPAYKLDILGTARIYSDRLYLDYTNAVGGINWSLNPFIATVANGGFEIYDNTNGASRFVINSTGNIGIGTTTPTLAKLQVNGNVWATSFTGSFSGSITAPGSNTQVIYNSSGVLAGSSNFVFDGNNLGLATTLSAWGSAYRNVLQVGGGGSLAGASGVGGNSPTYIAVGGNYYLNSSAQSVYITSNYASKYEQNAGLHSWHIAGSGTAGNVISFTQAMTLDTNGNLGIGSTSPGYTLTTAGRGYFFATNQDAGWGMLTLDYGNGVNNDIYAVQFKEGGAVNAALGFRSYDSSNLGDLKFYVNNGSGLTTAMIISGSGNVGIGTTSPGNKLTVRGGNIDVQESGYGVITNELKLSDYNTGIFTDGTNGNMTFSTYGGGTGNTFRWVTNTAGTNPHPSGGTTRMVMDKGGNVGFNVTTPVTATNYIFTTINGTNGSGYITQVNGTTAAYFYSIATETRVTEQRALPIVFETSGTERMRITSVGNVGIGTTSPLKTLQINATAPAIRLQENGSGGDKRLELSVSSSGVATIAANQSAQVLTFETVGSERLRIDSNGNVGIGTTSPTAILQTSGNTKLGGGTLHIASDQNFVTGSTYSFRDAVGIINPNATSFVVTSTAVMSIGSMTSGNSLITTGNVGIGTSSTSYKLDVAGNGRFTSTVSATKGIFSDSSGAGAVLEAYNTVATNATTAIIRQTTAGGNGNQDIGLLVDIQGANDADRIANFRYYNGSTYTSRMAITRGGNVGIGTTSPSQLLHILAPTGSYAYARIEGGFGGYGGFLELMSNTGGSSTDSAGRVDFYMTSANRIASIDAQRVSGGATYGTLVFSTANNATTPTERMRITYDGNVGIGTTSPSAKTQIFTDRYNDSLTFNATAGFIIGGSIRQLSINTDDTSPYNISFQAKTNANSSANLVFNSLGGNVLIGSTTDSGEKLQVNGTMKVTGASSFGGNVTISNLNSPRFFATGNLSNGFPGYNLSNTTQEYEIIVRGNDSNSFQIRNVTASTDLFTIASTGAATFSSSVTAVSFIETSTKTKKDNIKSYSTDINKFKQLEPVSFTWKDTGKSDVGLIAEEVEQLFPEFVSKTDEGEVTGINYGKLATIFINVLKQQQGKIEELEDKIKKLTS